MKEVQWNNIGLGMIIFGVVVASSGLFGFVLLYDGYSDNWGFLLFGIGILIIMAGNGFINYSRSNLKEIWHK